MILVDMCRELHRQILPDLRHPCRPRLCNPLQHRQGDRPTALEDQRDLHGLTFTRLVNTVPFKRFLRGTPQKWLVYVIENPNRKWMMTGGSPVETSSHFYGIMEDPGSTARSCGNLHGLVGKSRGNH